MLWNGSGFGECTTVVDIQAIAYVNHFPASLRFASRAASDLQPDHYQSHAAQLTQQMWLDGSNEPAVVPVHQSSLFDRLSKVH